MKKLLSLLLSVVMLLSVSAVSLQAFAAEVKFDLQHQQYNSQNAEFNYNKDSFVHHRYGKKEINAYIYSSKSLRKRGTKAVNLYDYTSLAVKGNYMFFVDASEGAIKRCKLNGKKVKTIVKFNPDKFSAKFIIDKNRMYYNLIQYGGSSDGIVQTKLYTCNLKGKKVKKVAKNVKSDFYTYKNNLYFVKGKSIYRYDAKTGKSKTVYVGMPMNGAKVISMENNTLYVAFFTDEDEFQLDLYAIDVTAQKYRRLERVKLDAPLHSIIASNDKFYVTTGTGAGNSFARVVNGKLDYKSYNDKYEYATENAGFFKNNIVVESSDYTAPGNGKYVCVVKNK